MFLVIVNYSQFEFQFSDDDQNNFGVFIYFYSSINNLVRVKVFREKSYKLNKKFQAKVEKPNF